MAAAMHRMREFLRVAGAGRGDALDPEARAAFLRDLRLARQKHDAATYLGRLGAKAEALGLAVQALSYARAAAARVPTSEATARRADELARAVEARTLPELDSDVDIEHGVLLEDLLDASIAVESELVDATLKPRTVSFLRVARPGVPLLVLALVIVAIAVGLHRPQWHIQASGAAEPSLAPQYVFDGDEKTEWSLPPKTEGWIEIIPTKPRPVKRIRILNSKNLPGGEHGAKEFQVLVASGGRVSKVLDGEFTAFSREPQWKTFDVDLPDVQRVRVVIKTWFGEGAGLAEIAIE